MLSLPLLQPESSILPYQHHYHRRADSPPPSNGRQQPHHPHQHRPAQRRSSSPNSRNSNNTRSPLAILAADEAAIAHRKAAIRNFGALWIRPPGISKTLQAMTEEAAELAEAEEQMRQEQGLRDLAAQQQLEEARMRAAEAGMQEDEGGEEEQERDLDAEIPDADDGGEDEEADEDEDEGNVTFNESSMVEGSRVEMEAERYAAIEEAELTGAAREMEELGVEREMEMERDLDDSVPEAGSYQHTDTEVEDSSSDSDSELNDSFAGRPRREQLSHPASASARRSTRSTRSSASAQGPPVQPPQQLQTSRIGGLQDRIRAQVSTPAQAGADAGLARSPGSLNLSSSLVESSMMGSSPVVQRGVRGQGGGRRRGRMS